MSYFSKLHSGFSYSLSSDLEKQFNSMPSVVKKQGQAAPCPDYPHWVIYENHTKSPSPWHQDVKVGSIAITQDTEKHFPVEIGRIVSELRSVWPKFDWQPECIHFLQTEGNVLPHRGNTRDVSLNIGVQNSSSSVTQVAMNNNVDDYAHGKQELATYQMRDGDIYLLNVTYLHSVWALEDRKRILITYTSTYSYEDLLNRLG